MNLLALDTATEACSCALLVGNDIVSRSELAPRRHAERILAMLDEVLSEAGIHKKQLDGLAFGRGPGSFTGVRIACGVAQGIAFALNIPVAPVSSLATLAQGAYRETGAARVLAAIDARMNEVYWGQYVLADGLMRLQSEEIVIPPQDLTQVEGDWLGWGSAWQVEALQSWRIAKQSERYPQAQDMLTLAQALFANEQGVAAEAAVPVYIRNQVTR
jgi:tRNA threonylcarbamoyladenosine biosynthesis protein TsaB